MLGIVGIVLAGVAAGILSGMGIGGGTLLIPALLLLTDLSQQQVQGINLVYFLPTAVIALFVHAKEGNIETKTAKPVILWGLFGAVAGALLAVSLDGSTLKKIFGGFLFLMGLSEIFKKKKQSS